MLPTIKWPSKLLKPSKNVKLVSNVLPLPLIRPELLNSSSNKCGNLPMVRSEIILEEQFSENQSLLKIFLASSLDGQNQWSSDVTLLVTNTEALILWYLNQVNLKSYTLPIEKELNQLHMKSTNLPAQVLLWVCITQISRLKNLLTHLSNMLFSAIIQFTSVPKIPFWRNMTDDSKIFLKPFTINIIKKNLKPANYGMNIDWLMIWLHSAWNLKVDTFGLAKIMTAMSNLILLLRDTGL